MRYPLLPFSQIVFQDVKDGRGEAWNMGFVLKACGIDADRLRDAIEMVVAHHPVFHMIITEDGMQEYAEGYRTPYFCYDIRVENPCIVLEIHFHRVLGDAASMGLFLENVNRAYNGEPLPEDVYLRYLDGYEALKHSNRYAADRAWLENHYDNITAPTNVPDSKPEDTDWGDVAQYDAALRIMDANGCDEAALTWSYLGRETAEEQFIFGSLHRDVPFLAHRGMTPQEVQRELEHGIIHSSYPYTFNAKDRERWKHAVNVQRLPSYSLAIGSTMWAVEEESLLAPSEMDECKNTDFMERFAENVRLYPEKVVLQDPECALTFRELNDISGRVYAYLKEKQLGPEDFVMLCLPYGVMPYAAMLGIWRAGAALVVADTLFGDERIRFIYNDCGCKLAIDSTVWSEILSTKPLAGHAEVNAHNAAFAVYTSGSEGKPKGVLHEYGDLSFMPMNLAAVVNDACAKPLPTESKQYSFVPISTIGAIAVCVMSAWYPMTSDIGSIALMKNPVELMKYIENRNLDIAFFPPSYYCSYCHMIPKTLKMVYLASEPLRNFYTEVPIMLNVYIQSEGFHVCAFKLDRKYTSTPIGKPVDADTVRLYDDDGNSVSTGELGELCYRNLYFRGYVNDAETTRKSFVGGYFRSGDIARKDADGNYVVLGRKTDMIKINGNRIEPAEIEAAVKRVLGIDWAFAKGFVEPERSFICVYYTADLTVDQEAVREELQHFLPAYMIPSYFIHVDEVPLLPNGKVNRGAFKAPEIKDFVEDYVAPTNDIEARLCSAMAQVLGLDRVGLDDDFYLIGGDSMRTIRLITQCGIENLTVTTVYQYRTPGKIAKQLL